MRLLIALVVLLVLVSAYALNVSSNVNELSEEVNAINKQLNGSTLNETVQIAYQVGQRVGYETAVIELANLAATCNPVPITLQNITFEVIAVDCLDQ